MNFLLSMLGQPHRCPPLSRQKKSQRLRTAAAHAAADGQLRRALDLYRQLATENDGSLIDLLIRAHLHLALRQCASASIHFAAAIERAESLHDATVGSLMHSADINLRGGLYVRSSALLQRARNTVDILLAAHAGKALAQAGAGGNTACAQDALVTLARLGDRILRLLAQAHLASNLAISLRQRALRSDLAPWATRGQSIDRLLCAEYAHLRTSAGLHPDHAELHYRLGLVARTLGDFETAAQAFAQVLSRYPHHVLSATRLVVTHLELSRGTESGGIHELLPLLAGAFTVPAETLRQYAALAAAAQTPAFEETIDQLCTRAQDSSPRGLQVSKASNPGFSRSQLQANLAFGLAEMGLLDQQRAQWREPVPT